MLVFEDTIVCWAVQTKKPMTHTTTFGYLGIYSTLEDAKVALARCIVSVQPYQITKITTHTTHEVVQD